MANDLVHDTSRGTVNVVTHPLPGQGVQGGEVGRTVWCIVKVSWNTPISELHLILRKRSTLLRPLISVYKSKYTLYMHLVCIYTASTVPQKHMHIYLQWKKVSQFNFQSQKHNIWTSKSSQILNIVLISCRGGLFD